MDPARLSQEYASLNPVYDPQRTLIQKQITDLPTSADAAKSALEQARINAFRDITSTAQGRGVYFSGFTPSEMARYTGEKYLPALAGITSEQNAAKTKLESALATINAQQSSEATSNLQKILDREQQQRQFEQELAASQAKAAKTAYAAEVKQAATPAGHKVKQGSQGQYMFSDKFGTPISMADYVQGNLLTSADVLNLLKNGTGYDRNIYQKVKTLSGDALQNWLSTNAPVYGF